MSNIQDRFEKNLQNSGEYGLSIASVSALRFSVRRAFDTLVCPHGTPAQRAQTALELLYEANKEISGAIRLLLGLPKDLESLLKRSLPHDIPRSREFSVLARAIRRLRENAGVETYGQLVRMTKKELSQVEGLGQGGIYALEEHLRTLCLQLDMQRQD